MPLLLKRESNLPLELKATKRPSPEIDGSLNPLDSVAVDALVSPADEACALVVTVVVVVAGAELLPQPPQP